ncbi:hypothetical protein RESH_05519 [Rhodopirellula europaea SH398]|uniref:Uncharacterized protein n=1 Tax=Rhodopirellula europaea SH398 TaxID=1263868 RepID=M5RXF5_9BACT|nr:hypothetical protein RESH_05519 [Rhodopirellula europaea SH398]
MKPELSRSPQPAKLAPVDQPCSTIRIESELPSRVLAMPQTPSGWQPLPKRFLYFLLSF